MNGWRILIETGRPTRRQMPFDEQLAGEGKPTVRFFSWESPAISLGYKQPAPSWLESPSWRKSHLECVERPTGGGIACHGSDLSFAVVVPRACGVRVESQMDAISQALVKLCKAYGVKAKAEYESSISRVVYCLAEPSPYSVFVYGRKIAGLALRRYPESWLIQGSLLINPLPGVLIGAMPLEIVERIRQRAVALSDVTPFPLNEQDVAQHLALSWSIWWEEALLETVGASCS
jgi:lipoate-protein ligase A